jgi:glycosyltransferase involved in cell wall biosynthesis
VYPAANRGFVPRLLDHTAFSLSALATARLSGPLDVVVAETPPLFTAAAGALYAQSKRAALVIHVADRWPASAVEMGALRNPQAIAAAEALERWVYRRADRILSPTEGIASTLAGLPEAQGKSSRVWPVVDIDRFDPEPPAEPDGAPLRLLFAGTVGLAHGLDVLVDASHAAGPAVVHTRIAGDGADAERIRELIRQRSIGNVEMLGVVGADRIPELYREADASAVLLRDLPIFAGALPTKMLEALAAGRPVLLSARGEAARFIEAAQAGLVVAPGDAGALAQAIRRLHAEPQLRHSLGASGRRYAESHFGTGRASEAWETELKAALRAHAQSASRRSWRAAEGRRQGG